MTGGWDLVMQVGDRGGWDLVMRVGDRRVGFSHESG